VIIKEKGGREKKKWFIMCRILKHSRKKKKDYKGIDNISCSIIPTALREKKRKKK